MFTYSDPSYENYLEDQRQKTPWQSDTAVLELKKYDTGESQISKALKGRVKEVIDGGTILLENDEIVKYIGIEAPKNGDKYFEDSKNFNKLLVDKKDVKLQFDLQGRDSDNNLLAYVFIEGIFVNAEIIKHGFARFVPHSKNTQYHDMFAILESEAIRFGKGVWSNEEMESR